MLKKHHGSVENLPSRAVQLFHEINRAMPAMTVCIRPDGASDYGKLSRLSIGTHAFHLTHASGPVKKAPEMLPHR